MKTARKNIYSIDLNYPGYAVSRKGLVNSINLIPDKPMVEIYPNPAGDILYVQHNPGKVNSLEILNLDGKEQSIQMKIKEETGIEINTQKLKSGTLGNQKLDSMIYNRFNYDNNQFFFDTKSSYTYDSNGNLTLDISSWYDSTYQWVMSDKSEYGTIRTITGLRPFPIPSKLPPANGW